MVDDNSEIIYTSVDPNWMEIEEFNQYLENTKIYVG